MSTMFTPITLLRFSFLPCAATLHVKARLLAFNFLDQDCDREAEKSKVGECQAVRCHPTCQAQIASFCFLG